MFRFFVFFYTYTHTHIKCHVECTFCNLFSVTRYNILCGVYSLIQNTNYCPHKNAPFILFDVFVPSHLMDHVTCAYHWECMQCSISSGALLSMIIIYRVLRPKRLCLTNKTWKYTNARSHVDTSVNISTRFFLHFIGK